MMSRSDMHKNAHKVEWKTRSKISWHYTWLLHAKICPSRWRFLRSFLTTSKPSRRSITAAKRKEKEKKKKGKKQIPNIEKPKDVGHFLVQISKFWFLWIPESQCGKTWCWWQESQAVVLQMHFRLDKANLAEIQLKKHQNVQKSIGDCNRKNLKIYLWDKVHGKCDKSIITEKWTFNSESVYTVLLSGGTNWSKFIFI